MHNRILVALAMLLLATPLAAQNHLNTIRQQLDAGSARLAQSGYRLDTNALKTHALTGLLPQDGSVALILDLTAGRNYQIMGVCDTDCDDLDLRLFDIANVEDPIKEDVLVDDVPILSFIANKTGTYLLFVDLAECSEEYCYFGVSVLTK